MDPVRSPDAAPVFLDATGRRHRRVRTAGWILAALVVAYMMLVAVSLSASPGFLPFSFAGVKLLPDAAAPKVPAARPPGGAGDRLSPSGVTTPNPGGSSRQGHAPVTRRPSVQPTSRPHPTGSRTPGPGRPTASPQPTASARPIPTPTPLAGSTAAHPTPTRTNHAGKPVHPTPTQRTGKPVAHPARTHASRSQL